MLQTPLTLPVGWCRVIFGSLWLVVPYVHGRISYLASPLQRDAVKVGNQAGPIARRRDERRPRIFPTMPLDAARPVFRTKQELVYRTLRDAILTCAIPPDERLVIEDVARRLNVSAIPVREALQLLQSEGPGHADSPRGRHRDAAVAGFGRRRLLGTRRPAGGGRPAGGRARRQDDALTPSRGTSGRWTRPWPTRSTTRGPT